MTRGFEIQDNAEQNNELLRRKPYVSGLEARVADLLRENERLRRWLGMDALSRLADYLLSISDQGVAYPSKRADIARQIGSCRETVSRLMGRLERDGVITPRYPFRGLKLDEARLREILA